MILLVFLRLFSIWISKNVLLQTPIILSCVLLYINFLKTNGYLHIAY